MKKISLVILSFLFCSIEGIASENESELEKTILVQKKGVYQPRCSAEIDETDQYFGLPKVPLIHHYTDFNPPIVLLALKGNLPKNIFLKNKNLRDKMEIVGVKSNDPFLIVVQSFSTVDDDNHLLLRPMYYFGQNKKLRSETRYCETINLKAAVLGITSELSIIPDKIEEPYKFGVSIHTSQPELISSSDNMVLPELRYNKSQAFYGVYKGIDRNIDGGIKDLSLPEDLGVTVLHVVLNSDQVDIFNNYLDEIVDNPTVRNLVKALKLIEQDNQSGKEFASILYRTIENMIREEKYNDTKNYWKNEWTQKINDLNESFTIKKEDYDRAYIELVLLPEIRKIVQHPAYDSYEGLLKFEWTGYTKGMNPDEYWQTVWASKTESVPEPYQLPEHLISREKYDKAYIELFLLPEIRKLYQHPAYDSYEGLLKFEWTGYTKGMNPHEYWQTVWALKTNASIQKYEVPVHLMNKKEFDKYYINTVLLPEIRKVVQHPAFDSYENFIKTSWTGYEIGMDLNEYWQTVWASKTNTSIQKYELPKLLKKEN
jgi:hypothetical protein